MPTDFGFRFSTYLALALAVVSLGYAEWELLPSASIFAVIVLGMMVFTFRRDGRNELSLAMANRVGFVLGLVMTIYLALKLILPAGTLIHQLPFPASLLPYLGPVLMVLIPAKLLRPKHEGDWWALHGIGLVVVALACSMCEEPEFFVLVAAYAVAGVWSLMLFYFRRGAGMVPLIPNLKTANEPKPRTAVAPQSPAKSKFGGIKLRRPVGYLITVGVLGLGLFLITPRSEGPRWSMTFQREVGFNTDDQAPDLTKTGDLKENKDRAFEVRVTNPDGTAKNDLSMDQRWRGTSYGTYHNGKWLARGGIGRHFMLNGSSMPQATQAPPKPPENGWVIDFSLNGKRKDPVFSDPTWWSTDQPPPITTFVGGQHLSWIQSGDGTFMQPTGRTRVRNYRQVTKEPWEHDLGPVFQLARGSMSGQGLNPGIVRDVVPREFPKTEDEQYLMNLEGLRFQPLLKVKDWTDQLLLRLVKEEKLPETVLATRDPDTGYVKLEHFEKVAQAVGNYFVNSGEFNYGTKTERVDNNLDPVEDFLLNTKSGTCEWYATALTLCLRSAGVPAHCVLGFKGVEFEEDGRYIVRQDHAHAWVEVLVPRPIPEGARLVMETDFARNPIAPPTKFWGWLTIDPTPGSGVDEKPKQGIIGLWSKLKQKWGQFYSDFVVRYDPERRQRMVETLEKWSGNNWRGLVASGLFSGSIICVFILLRRLRRKPVTFRVVEKSTAPEWYQIALDFCQRAGFKMEAGETPKDFSTRVSTAKPSASEPLQRLTDTLYALRYAGNPDVDQTTIKSDLETLYISLATSVKA